MRTFILCLLLCVLQSIYCAVQADLDRLSFRSIGTGKGLVSAEVTCFLQDHSGFIWVGTTNGLCRYDGYEFKSYKSNYLSPDFFTGNSIRCLAKDKKERLLIGTTSGLNIFDLTTGKITQYSLETMNCGMISAVAVDNNDNVYVGTAVGILYFDEEKGTFENIREDSRGNKIRGNYIQSLFVDSRNVLWVGMWHTGFCALDLNDRVFFFYPDVVDKKQLSVTSFMEDADNHIWLSTWNEDGVYRLKNPLQKEIFECVKYPILYNDKTAPSAPSVYGLVQDDKEGYIWIATSDGLRIVTEADNPRSIIEYRDFDKEGMTSNEISAVYKDRTGIIWLSMYGAGISSVDLNKEQFSEYYFPELKRNKEIKAITSVYEDEKGLLWLGIKALNLILFDPTKKKVYRYYQHPVLKDLASHSNAIMGFARHSSRNELWLATRYHGVYVLKLKNNEPQRLIHLDESLLKSPNTNRIAEGLNGYMWVATSEGLNYIEKENSDNYLIRSDIMLDSLIGKNIINTLCFDKKQTLWVGTQDDGLFRIGLNHDGTPKQIVQYNIHNDKINNNSIVSLFIDSKNLLWVGTNGGGLSSYDQEADHFEVIPNMTALPDDAIYAIQEDDSGSLWLSTGKGLVRYTVGYPAERQIKVFDAGDGVFINSFFPEASCRGRNGSLFFGGTNGLLWFSSGNFKENTFSPAPVITDISIGNRSISDQNRQAAGSPNLLPPYTKEVRLSYKNNTIKIEFSALSFENPMSKTYAYRLEGIDEDWIYVKAKDKYAVYNSLKQGTYRFHVKAYNEDGYTDNSYASLKIIRLPAPWETVWAYLFYISAALALIYLIFRFFLHKEKMQRALQLEHMERVKSDEVHQAKLQFFTNVSHELFTPITVLSCSLDDMEKHYPADSSLIYIMRMNLNRLMRLLQQILEFRKAETGNLQLRVSQGNIAAFVYDICELSFMPLVKNKQISLSFRSEPEVLIGYFDSDKLDKIVYNLLSNAYKYNEVGGTIDISLSKEQEDSCNFLVIKVRDTGQGIEPQKMQHLFKRFYEGDYRKFKTKGTGIGLSLTKDLITLHRGTIDVWSEPGKGSLFTVRLPIDVTAYSDDQIEAAVPDVVAVSSLSSNALTKECSPLEELKKDISVLIAEDNEDLLTVLTNALSRCFEVFSARHGKEALQMLEENDIDVVVTDYVMPEMDGIELTHFIKKEVRYSHVPIILLTAKQHAEDKIIGFEAGADVYITKPFEVDTLIANIKSLVKNRRQISSSFSNKDRIKLSQFTYNSVDEEFLEKAIKVVEDNIRVSDFNTADFYQAMNMSQPTLYRKIKSITNLSPNEFIRNIKFKLACKLLVERKLSITEVAYELGYIDSRYFSTVFKKEIGLSPSEYIRKSRGEISAG